VADYSAQAVVISYLKTFFPNDFIVAEESADEIRKDSTLLNNVLDIAASALSGTTGVNITANSLPDIIDQGSLTIPDGLTRFWTLDPVDGTKGFLRKEQYAVCLSLVENGQVVLSCIGCPNLKHNDSNSIGSLFFASRNNGAYQVIMNFCNNKGFY
jgi:3'(2'), 5'-bisphosphate nucleotidase